MQRLVDEILAYQDKAGKPLASVRVARPLDCCVTLLVLRWSGWGYRAFDRPVPDGVTVTVRSAYPDTVLPIHFTDLRQEFALAAWRHGAWDVQQACIGPWKGPMPPWFAGYEIEARTYGWVLSCCQIYTLS